LAERFDVVVIGGGPGGYAAGLYGASAGLNVAVVEQDKVGGTCLHRGCIPAKEFLETAAVYRSVSGAKEFGINTDQPTIDFSVSQARKQRVVDAQWKGLQGTMKRRKITTVIGRGQLAPNKVVKVSDGTELTADNIILASGSTPRTIPGFERDGKFVLTSDEVLDLEKLPSSIAVIGGGAIGCEFASMMSDLGVKVTLLEALPKILAGCDNDVADVIVKSFTKRGMDVRVGVQNLAHKPNTDNTTVVTWEKAGEQGGSVEVEAIIVSVGRKPNTDNLLIGDTGVQVSDRGFIEVDEWMHTGVDGIWAIGDVVATAQLAHVGFAEAILAIKGILGEDAVPVDYNAVPWCIYTHPEVAFAGYSEQAARDAGFDVVVRKHPFSHVARSMIVGDTEGLVKIIAEKDASGNGGRVLGVHMAGPWVTEQLGAGYLAVNWEATVDEVAQFIQPHPTLSETFGEAIIALTGRGLHAS
jgi:dihydrolipoamide dehydrogenase